MTQERSSPTITFFLVLVAVTALAAFLFFWGLGVKPLENWDEGIHAEVSREMYRGGSWLSMTYRDEPYFAKPPLKFWLTTAFFSMFGESEFAIRLWSAVAGVATVVLLAFWGWQVTNSVRYAFLAGALFATGRYVFFHAFRTGETDGLLVLFIVAALYAYWRSWGQPRWFIVFGVIVGLAVMTKSFAGLIPALVVALDLSLGRRWSKIGFRTIAWSAGLAAAIILPWHVIELARHGWSFWNNYFTFHILERTSDVLYKNVVPWYWYAEIIMKRMFPYSAFMPIALLLAVRRMIRHRDELDRLLLLWIGVVFILFSFVQTKFDWYILPIYPALALLLTRGIYEFLHVTTDRLALWGMVASFALALAILPLGLAHEGLLWKLTPYGYLPFDASTTFARVAMAVLAIVVLTLLGLALRRRLVANPVRLFGIVATAYFLVLSFGWQASYLRHLPTTSPLKFMAEAIASSGVENLDVVRVSLLTQPAGYFYLRRIPGLVLREVKGGEEIKGPLVLTTKAGLDDSLRSQTDAILERDRFILLKIRGT